MISTANASTVKMTALAAARSRRFTGRLWRV
jgi:hypothetical protein